jgi:hypothetical protein
LRAVLGADSRLVVISHDCDVTQQLFDDEPHVELLLVHPIPALQGHRTYGKHPRYLDFPMLIGGSEHYYEAHATARFLVDRRLLLEITPDINAALAPQMLDVARRWLAARYTRVAFPDELNARLDSADKKLDRAMKRLNRHLSAVYCSLNSREDLPTSESYKMGIIGVMPVEHYKDPTARGEAQKSLDTLATAIRGCRGIEVIEADLRSEEDITMDACRYLMPLNFTYLSLRDGADAILPPAT